MLTPWPHALVRCLSPPGTHSCPLRPSQRAAPYRQGRLAPESIAPHIHASTVLFFSAYSLRCIFHVLYRVSRPSESGWRVVPLCTIAVSYSLVFLGIFPIFVLRFTNRNFCCLLAYSVSSHFSVLSQNRNPPKHYRVVGSDVPTCISISFHTRFRFTLYHFLRHITPILTHLPDPATPSRRDHYRTRRTSRPAVLGVAHLAPHIYIFHIPLAVHRSLITLFHHTRHSLAMFLHTRYLFHAW